MTDIDQKFKKEVERLLPGVKNNVGGYTLSIERLNSGFIVSIGCKRFAVADIYKVNEMVKVYMELIEVNEVGGLDELWYRYFNPSNSIRPLDNDQPKMEMQDVQIGSN